MRLVVKSLNDHQASFCRSTIMASSMSGMFLGQQQSGPHPSGGPGGPGQPGMLPGPSGARGSNSNTLVDDLEAAFEVSTLVQFTLCPPC